MKISQALKLAAEQLKAVGIELAYLEARVLASHLLQKPIEYLLVNDSQLMPADKLNNFLQLVRRRAQLEPVAYIIGHKEFYGRQFQVNKNVLIPRAETELLVEAALSYLPDDQPDAYILELGVGSGCVIISLLLERLKARAVAIDISIEALMIAQGNARMYGVQPRLKLVHSDWFSDLAVEEFDVIISNPPYVSVTEQRLLALETLRYEPQLALFGKQDGLEHYYSIAQFAKNFLKKNGQLFLEIGFDQCKMVNKIFVTHGYIVKNIYQDISGYSRVLQLRK